MFFQIELKGEKIYVSDFAFRQNLFNQDFFINEKPLVKIISTDSSVYFENFNLNSIKNFQLFKNLCNEKLADGLTYLDIINRFNNSKAAASKKLQTLIKAARKNLTKARSLLEIQNTILESASQLPTLNCKNITLLPYFLAKINEPLLLHCKTIADIRETFSEIKKQQDNTISEINEKLNKAQKIISTTANPNKKYWLTAITKDLQFALLNEQSKTFSLSHHTTLSQRLRSAKNHYTHYKKRN